MALSRSTRTEDELDEALERGLFRKDFFSFGWNKKSSRQQHLSSRLQYLLPQSFRWIGDAALHLLFDSTSLLKLDTEHLAEVHPYSVARQLLRDTTLLIFLTSFHRW